MLNLEKAFLFDICLGYPFGKLWFPAELPYLEVKDIPETYLLNGKQLAAIKYLSIWDDKKVTWAVEGLRNEADQLKGLSRLSVTNKLDLNAGVSPNDYYSLAKYWWPDFSSPDGLPYINRDGEVNPDCYNDRYDLNRLELFSQSVLLLSVAAFITDDIVYAEKANQLIRTWLIDPETRQAPHFRYAQIIPGKEKLLYYGLIEARRMIYVCEALQLLRNIKAINNEDYQACKGWFAELLEWFENSEQGNQAAQATNNIGFWYDLQRLVYARFTGKNADADNIIRNSVIPRSHVHITKQGLIPAELTRAKPYDYVAFTLLAMAGLNTAAKHGDIKLADYSDDEGRSFQNAYDWFSKTINANKLQDQSVALNQIVRLKQTVKQLDADNNELEVKLKRYEAVARQSKSSTASINDTNEIHTITKEFARLREELDDNYDALFKVAMQYRGVEYFLNQQAELLNMTEPQLLENARTNLTLQEELKEARSIIEQFREELHQISEKMKTRESEFKTRESEFKTRESEFRFKEQKLTKKYLDAEEEKTHYKREYTKVINSRIWRITAPLRKLSSLVKSNSTSGKNTAGNLGKPSDKQPKSMVGTDDPLKLLHSVKPVNIDKLKAEYIEKGLVQVPDTFALYRIIGNDLYPRHKKGQSRENLKFILENEPAFENCEKIFVVNRIIDSEEEKAIFELLNKHDKEYIHIPFKEEEYKKIGYDTECLPELGYLASQAFANLGPLQKARVRDAVYRLKNNYVMNNNGARNTALQDGKKRAKWVLPWDGNCFISGEAWLEIYNEVVSTAYLKYFVVPMARITDNSKLFTTGFKPKPVEEPQLIFRRDATENFNEDFCYGRRPKIELFWRLGIPGKWDKWNDDPWDSKRRSLAPESRQFGVAGWVARLSSGVEKLEQDNYESFKNRGLVRSEAIIKTLQSLDAELNEVSDQGFTSFCEGALLKEKEAYLRDKDVQLRVMIEQLINNADEALSRGPYSVIDKTTLPPSGNAKDYWHPSPYWWPNPNTKDGLPYIRRDGQRAPGTLLYEKESEKYDRTRLQMVFDDSIILALAWILTDNNKYVHHVANILDRFFVNPNTGMTPHLMYSQVIRGKNNNIGNHTGIIEMKDFYYYLDALRLLNMSGVIDGTLLIGFKEWLKKYLNWLITSVQGKKECQAVNNHGTYYDLQVASIASYLGEHAVLNETLIRAQTRIAHQFAIDGSQPSELKRTITAHYCCFNLQGWLNLGTLASRWGVNLWSYEAPNGASLKKGAEWLLSHTGQEWPYRQIEEFDSNRFYPIYFTLKDLGYEIPVKSNMQASKYAVKPLFHPHDGIQPYWNLGRE